MDDVAVARFFAQERPEIVIFAAARVGGIKANNDLPVEFLLENLANPEQRHPRCARSRRARSCSSSAARAFIRSSRRSRFRNPRFLPACSSRPTRPTRIAKIAGIKLCQAYAREYGANFISAMPTNLYGPNDNFDLLSSHVLAGAAAQGARGESSERAGDRGLGFGHSRGANFCMWTTWPRACLFLLENYDSPEIINVGCGEDITIRELAELICDVVGFRGRTVLGSRQSQMARRASCSTFRNCTA